MFPFLARFCSSQRTGIALVGRLWLDVTNVMGSKRSKNETILLPVAVRGSRTSVLKFKLPTTTTAKYVKVSANFFYEWTPPIAIMWVALFTPTGGFQWGIINFDDWRLNFRLFVGWWLTGPLRPSNSYALGFLFTMMKMVSLNWSWCSLKVSKRLNLCQVSGGF